MIATLPDVERLVSRWLREHPAVDPLVAGERIYTAFPSQAGNDPLLLIQRVGGTPPLSQPLVIDEAQLQLDAYGGSKAQAHELIATTRAALCELEGAVLPEGTVAAVRFGALRWLPDDTYKPGRPRYVADVTLTTRPVVPAPTPSRPAGDRLAGAALVPT